MQANSLGKIAVPTPGTLVQVSADTAIKASRIRFQAPAANTNPAYVGVAGMVKTTFVGVIGQLAAGGVMEVHSADGSNSLNLTDYYVDVTTAAEGVVVSYWVR